MFSPIFVAKLPKISLAGFPARLFDAFGCWAFGGHRRNQKLYLGGAFQGRFVQSFHVGKPRFSAFGLFVNIVLQWSFSYKFNIPVTYLCVSSYCNYYYDTIHGGTRASVDNVQAFLSTVFVDLDSSHCGVVLLHFGASDEGTDMGGRGGFSYFLPFRITCRIWVHWVLANHSDLIWSRYEYLYNIMYSSSGW